PVDSELVEDLRADPGQKRGYKQTCDAQRFKHVVHHRREPFGLLFASKRPRLRLVNVLVDRPHEVPKLNEGLAQMKGADLTINRVAGLFGKRAQGKVALACLAGLGDRAVAK